MAGFSDHDQTTPFAAAFLWKAQTVNKSNGFIRLMNVLPMRLCAFLRLRHSSFSQNGGRRRTSRIMNDLWHIDAKENRGVCLRFAEGVDNELKKKIQAFCRWIRRNFVFPIKLNIFISDAPYIVNSQTGEKVSATIFLPDDRSSPLARISTGNYLKDIEEIDLFSADCNVLASIAHEITHYFQWWKDDSPNAKLDERQARRKAKQIVYKYLDDCFFH